MIEVKNKTVTVESLSALHEHDKNTYMPMVNPIGSGTMTMSGDALFTGCLTIGSNIKLISTGDSLSIVFLDEEEVAQEEVIDESVDEQG